MLTPVKIILLLLSGIVTTDTVANSVLRVGIIVIPVLTFAYLAVRRRRSWLAIRRKSLWLEEDFVP